MAYFPAHMNPQVFEGPDVTQALSQGALAGMLFRKNADRNALNQFYGQNPGASDEQVQQFANANLNQDDARAIEEANHKKQKLILDNQDHALDLAMHLAPIMEGLPENERLPAFRQIISQSGMEKQHPEFYKMLMTSNIDFPAMAIGAQLRQQQRKMEAWKAQIDYERNAPLTTAQKAELGLKERQIKQDEEQFDKNYQIKEAELFRPQNTQAKAPPGYKFSADGETLEAIPGGPAAGVKPLTDDQAKAGGFLERMIEGRNEMVRMMEPQKDVNGNIIGPPEYDPSSSRSAADRTLTKMGMGFGVSGPAQKFLNNARNYTMANLRRETGAAMPEYELEDQYKIYIPQPWDKPETIKQKIINMDKAIESMRLSAGPNYKGPGAKSQESAPKKDDHPEGAKFRLPDGRTVIKRNGRYYPLGES